MKNKLIKLNSDPELYINLERVAAIHYNEQEIGFFMDCQTDRSGSTQLYAKYESEKTLKKDLQNVIKTINS